MQTLRSTIKKLLGNKIIKYIRPFYHGSRSFLGSAYYGFPSKKVQLIGLTGTKGKTTTTVFIGRLLNLLGIKTGYLSSSVINLGQGEFLNTYKMSTLDGVIMHRFIKQMVGNGCQTVVIEMTSQGLEQNRHCGLDKFDIGVYLGMFPEHLEAHGNWEKYRSAKAILFRNLKNGGVFIGNDDDWETDFMRSKIKNKANITQKLLSKKDYKIISHAENMFESVEINGQIVDTQLIADFDLSNAYFALQAVESATNKGIKEVLPFLSQLQTVPGRMEFVHLHKTYKNLTDLSILVDYAHEPESMKLLMNTVSRWKKQGFFDQIIHILSADGAGRDDWKKSVMGEISFAEADWTIATTDNYTENDDPEKILELLTEKSPIEIGNTNILKIINRKEAMQKALEIASQQKSKKNLIISTGVGSEQGLIQPNGKINWDEREVWKDLLK